MNKNNILVTIKKELRSIFRDKKTIRLILGFPFVIALFIFFFGFMEDTMMGTDNTNFKVAFNYEVSIIEQELLEQYNLEAIYYENVESMKKAYEDGIVDSYVLYESYKNNYIVYAGNDVTGMNVSGLVMSYLEDYNQYLGNVKLAQNNIDPEVIFNNFTFEVMNITGDPLSTSSYMVELIMGISFTYIIMAIALASVNMATSAIAVEKEHGTLETILTLPITTTELIVGKYLATVIIGIISSIIGFILTLVSFGIASNMFEMYEKFSINFGTIIWGCVICVVASLLIAGLAVFVTSSSKTYKEAQASGQILSLLCVVPIFLSYLDITITEVYYFIPILNYTTILMDLYTGGFKYICLFITIGSTIIYILIILKILLKKFKSEKVIFG